MKAENGGKKRETDRGEVGIRSGWSEDVRDLGLEREAKSRCTPPF